MSDPRTDVVYRIFGGTAATYDDFVERATLRLDSRWKEEIYLHMKEPRRVLDLASGTGIVSFGIATRWPSCRVTGVDLQKDYCDISRQRAAEHKLGRRVKFICERAEDAQLEAGSFDHVVTSYLPKYADLPLLTSRIHDWLEPGGRVVLHDFTLPAEPEVRRIWTETFERLLMEAEASGSEWTTMMRELPGILRRTDWVAESCRELERCGFRDVTVDSLSMGCAAIVSAEKGS